jgi:hypothetical protein
MQVRREVFLDAEEELVALRLFLQWRIAARFRRFLEVAFLAIVLESHRRLFSHP